jgi:outer membrane receptor protein involved in Fe transport
MPPPEEGAPSQGSLASNSPTRIESELHALRPAGYFEAALQPTAALLLVPGVRVDYFSDIRAWTVDPRLSTRLALNEATTLKGGAGAYSQPGQYWEVMEGFGNPKVKPFRTLQASAGVEQKLGNVLTADLDGFYKRWEDRVLGTPGGAPPHYVNGGSGRAYGIELLLQAKLGERYSGFASYTLSRSTRRDGAGEPVRLFDRDQTHNLSVGASAKLGYGIRVGARFRYVTGSPYSAVHGAVYDASTDTYRPLYGVVNDARNPAFHQLDLRVEKLWHVGPVDLTAYLELMNAYNAENQESRRYSFDYHESSSVVGLPFFPNLGLRGEL